ncbi:MAG TPA: hypothetical protein VK540_32955 [Polyangiaceae bacterium]|nr:hypothetical protein [Polyangiaceae bacterium]
METTAVSRRGENGYSAFDPDRDLQCGTDAEPICHDEASNSDVEHTPGVMLCERPAQIPVADQMGLMHHWLKTSHKEAGLGPEDGSVPGDGKSALPFSKTRINDHTGQSLRSDAGCIRIACADEACVDERLDVGQLAGRWTPSNNCQTFVAEILAYCSVASPQAAPVHLGAEGGRNR